MKPFANANPVDLHQAAGVARDATAAGRRAVFAGGGSDLLGLIKERLVVPDVVVNLKTAKGTDTVAVRDGEVRIGGLVTLAALSRDARIRAEYPVLAEAAESVATPQIRNTATLAGNICQRPWCWYFRNGFPCLKNGGSTCFAITGENQFHAIFGGGPSYIVHPSDTAPALLAVDARLRLVSTEGERVISAAEFFSLPRVDPRRENVLADGEIVAEIILPPSKAPGRRSTYFKVLDREAWTHAVVSAAVVLDLDGGVCRGARVVLGGVAPVPWRLPEVEKRLAGRRVTPELAAEAAEIAGQGANPLAQNGYKVGLTKSVVERTLIDLAARA